MTTNELLLRFVAKVSETREYMRSPVLKGEFVYATNGHIVIRVPYDPVIDHIESDKLDNFPALFVERQHDAFIDLPELPAAEQCNVCLGSGQAYRCPDCDGEGEFEHGLHSYSCKECNGSGQSDHNDYGTKNTELCDACDGYGKKRGQQVKVGSMFYDRRYLQQIIDLPYHKFSEPKKGLSNLIAYFTFLGGEGLLMPIVN